MSSDSEYNKLGDHNIPNREKDCYRDHEGSNYICVMKLFPTCWITGELQDYQRFHLRFYFPKKVIAAKNDPKNEHLIHRIIIMINGINEVYDLTLYNQLGAKFAEHGIASVLLPLPDHFNRNVKFRVRQGGLLNSKPSDELFGPDGPEKGFKAYLQIMQEVDMLLEHLQYSHSKPCGETSCNFFKRLFTPFTRVSILGYSLGSSVALANFICNLNKYNTCYILSGGFQLSDLHAGKLFSKDINESQDIWNNFVLNLKKEWVEKDTLRKLAGKEEKHSKYFDQIYLGNSLSILKEELKNHTRKILVILGGKDTIIPYESIKTIEPEGHGLSILKIPGLDHFLATGKEWSKWSDIVVNLINNFEENAAHELYTHTEIIEGLIKLNFKYKRELFKFDEENKLNGFNRDKIYNEGGKLSFDNLMFASMAYYKLEALLKQLNEDYKKYQLGQIAIKKKFMEKTDLENALKLKNTSPHEKLGQLLIQRKDLKPYMLEEILKEQKNFYGDFWVE